ncbi:hypothetical protein GCM10027176_40410 [Actinoallomurus bryophytorum]
MAAYGGGRKPEPLSERRGADGTMFKDQACHPRACGALGMARTERGHTGGGRRGARRLGHVFHNISVA